MDNDENKIVDEAISSTSDGLRDNKNGGDEETCIVCLDSFNMPIMLPCRHKYCFLCIKGVVLKTDEKVCPHCRYPIPASCVKEPNIFVDIPNTSDENGNLNMPIWYYQGDGGWWRYDPRSSDALEQTYSQKRDKVEISIGAFTYIVDFKEIVRESNDYYVVSSMIQFRKDRPKKRRLVKRVIENDENLVVRGVAGISTMN